MLNVSDIVGSNYLSQVGTYTFVRENGWGRGLLNWSWGATKRSKLHDISWWH
jgi:hypothetical protein